MRPERLYLLDIVEAADNVVVHIAGRDRDSFLENATARAAVLHELTVIGAGAARLPEDFRARHLGVPWTKIVAFRNFVVHEYFGLDWSIVWQTATDLVLNSTVRYPQFSMPNFRVRGAPLIARPDH